MFFDRMLVPFQSLSQLIGEYFHLSEYYAFHVSQSLSLSFIFHFVYISVDFDDDLRYLRIIDLYWERRA